MKKNILEQIIRQVLSEASITVDIETLRPEDERKMKTVHTMLKMNSRLNQETDRFSAADGFLIKIKRVGGRVKDDTTGEKTETVVDTNVDGFPMKPVQKLSFEEIRSRLPREITDDIVRLISNSSEALQDFAYIKTQQDVNQFNVKYGVNLVLPQNV
jgi:hypothetical protein